MHAQPLPADRDLGRSSSTSTGSDLISHEPTASGWAGVSDTWSALLIDHAARDSAHLARVLICLIGIEERTIVGYHLGVDLGTTFVAAALTTDSGVEMFTLGDRAVVTPAVVYLREDGSLVCGDAAARRAVSSPDRIAPRQCMDQPEHGSRILLPHRCGQRPGRPRNIAMLSCRRCMPG